MSIFTGSLGSPAPDVSDAGAERGVATGAAWFVGIVSAYCLLHVAVRLLITDSVEHDEAEQLLLGQSLALGYGPHPPLYTWLQHVFFETVGVGVLSLALVKHLILFATYLFCFLAARLMLRDSGLAMLTAFSLWLIPQIGWEAHRDLTHSVLATGLASATTYAFLKLVALRRAWLYVILGVLVGLGPLSKYNFVLFAAALAVAAVSLDAFRGAMLDARILLSVAAAAAVVAPHLVWLAGHLDVAISEAPGKLGLQSRSLEATVTGFLHLVSASVGLVGPLVGIVAVFFPRVCRARPGGDTEGVPYRRLFERFLLAVLASLLLGVVLLGVTNFKGRWMLPLLFLTPMPLFLRIQAVRPGPRRLRAFAWTVAAFGLLAFALRFGEVWIGPRVGIHSRLHIPVSELAEQIRAAGFRSGTIVAEDKGLGGNLRLHFTDSRILIPALPYVSVPAPAGAGQCLVVWRPRRETAPPASLARFVAEQLGQPLPETQAPTVIQAPMEGSETRPYQVALILLPEGRGRCGRAVA